MDSILHEADEWSTNTRKQGDTAAWTQHCEIMYTELQNIMFIE